MDKTLLRAASDNEKQLQRLVEKYGKRSKDLKALEEANLLQLRADMKINIKDFDTAVDLIKGMPDEDFEKFKKLAEKEYKKDVGRSVGATLLSAAAGNALAIAVGSPIAIWGVFKFDNSLDMETHECKNDKIHYSDAEKHNLSKASYLMSQLKKNYESAFEDANSSALKEATDLWKKDKERIVNKQVSNHKPR